MRFVVQSQTAIDTRSGLMWPLDAGLTSFPLTWPEALAFVRDLNRQACFGFTDWRLPNRRELFSLVSYAAINPALPEGHPFRNVFNGYYWSSTTCDRLPDEAWYVHLGGARVFKGMKHGSYMVWPVRTAQSVHAARTGQYHCYAADGSLTDCDGSGQDGDTLAGRPWPQPRFEAAGHAVTDHVTGLVWNRSADQTTAPVDWENAHTVVSAANEQHLHGYKDWRLPTVRELESLCDMGSHNPALPHCHFFERVRPYYWSATSSRYDTRYAWVLYMEDGAVGVGYKPLCEFYVWLVRDANDDPWHRQ